MFRLLLLFRPSVGPLSGHITGLIALANSNLAPSGPGLRPEHVFFFSVLFPFAIFSNFFFGGMHIPWICPWYHLDASDMGRYTTVR